MLKPFVAPEFSTLDRNVFDATVKFDHWVRHAQKHVDFLGLRKSIEHLYNADVGCPGIEPVLMIKLELLLYHENLSDAQLWKRVETDLAYRWFLGLGLNEFLPDKSSLSRFRSRLGTDGHRKLFDALLSQIRQHGLVRDRLRIKDATHIIADIAVPAGLRLIAQARNRLLAAAEPFDSERVAGERVRIETVRTSTDALADDSRLAVRIEHLRDILAWTDELTEPSDASSSASQSASPATNWTWQNLVKAREIVRKALAGHDQPEVGDKLRSVSDPDARRGRHGDFYDGYMVDVLIDADSEFFTAINVLPASGNEPADTLTLLDQETSAHGNTIEAVSIDGAGFNGPLLRELEQERGIVPYVPPKQSCLSGQFGPEDFTVSDDGSCVTCPAGQTSQYRQYDVAGHSTSYRFPAKVCAACLRRGECMKSPMKAKSPELVETSEFVEASEVVGTSEAVGTSEVVETSDVVETSTSSSTSKKSMKPRRSKKPARSSPSGRKVRINDYASEYAKVRERSQSDEYASVKREHPAVERRLGHLMNRYDNRRARFRGLGRVLAQQLMGGMTANLDRLIRSLNAQAPLAFQ